MDRAEAARGAATFVARVLADLEAIAHEHEGLELLAYLIETARAEAEARARPLA